MNYILGEHLVMDHFHEDQLHIHILVVDDKDLTIQRKGCIPNHYIL
jgi:hypothetical protein